MRRSSRLPVALTILLGLAAQAPARAGEPPAAPSKEALDDAKRHFDQGVALYLEGNYPAAQAEFEAAYRSHPSAGVLYNIGLTQKALFRYTEAIVSLERYLAESRKITKQQRVEVEQLVREMKALLAEVKVDISPAGAQVIVDGRAVGVAPIAPLTLAAGNHVIEASADGYRPARKELTVVAGAPQALAIALESLPRTGMVKIGADRPLAQIRIDGRLAGTAPLSVELLAGGHTLEVTAAGCLPYQSELVVTAGQEREVTVSLREPPPPPVERTPAYKKWWPWTIAVVGAAGIAAGIAVPLATQREPPLVGTLNPGAAKVN